MQKLRRVGAVVCVVLMAVMIPVSVLGVWAKGQLLDEQRFVHTFAPLVTDPDVQVALTAEVSRVIIEQVDVDAVTAEAFAGLGDLGLPDRATAAIGLLQGPAAEGMRSLIFGATERFVTSPAFATVWQSALQVSHRALLTVATQDSFANGVLTTSAEGEVAIQLEPIVSSMLSQLESRGYGFAANIGPVEASFVIAQSDALPLVAMIYGLADGVGTWAPVVLLVCAAAAVGLSVQRRSTLLQICVTLLGVSVLLLIVCAVVVAAVPGSVTAQDEGAAAIAAVLSQVLGGVRTMSWWIVAFSVAGAVATLLFWPKSRVVAGDAVTVSQ